MTLIIVGESGSGKSTLAKTVQLYDGYHSIVVYTTRPPREGEIDGIDYHFISEEEFLKRKQEGFFAEWSEYRDWYYGTAKADYTTDKKVVAVLTPRGMRQVKKSLDNVFTVHIQVDRRDRMIALLERGDAIEEAYRRNVSDLGQFDGVDDEVDFIVNNDGYKKLPIVLAQELREAMEKNIK